MKHLVKKLVPAENSGRDWTPVRDGPVYCSPACGSRCTWREYRRAVRDADDLVKQLRGEGWRPRVWENLGWHFGAVSGPVQIYGDRRGPGGRLRYSCLISDEVDGNGGSMIWNNQEARSYSDPREAVAEEFLAATRATLGVVRALGRAARAAGREVESLALEAIVGPSHGHLSGGASVADKALASMVRSDRSPRRGTRRTGR